MIGVTLLVLALLYLFFRYTRVGPGDARRGRQPRTRRGSSASASAG